MRKSPLFASLASLFAIVAGVSMTGSTQASAASGEARALSLNVIEMPGSVEIEVVADSQVTQQVEFEVELTGASNSRHKSSVGLASGDRQVLSRMRINTSDSWCAKLDVSEASGARYTVTAGDCGLI